MRTVTINPSDLRKGDVLPDGGVVESEKPVDHFLYVAVIVKYSNGSILIRDFDKHRPILIIRQEVPA